MIAIMSRDEADTIIQCLIEDIHILFQDLKESANGNTVNDSVQREMLDELAEKVSTVINMQEGIIRGEITNDD